MVFIYVENENGKEYKQMTAKEILVAQYNKFLSGLENEKLGQKTWSWYKDGLFGDSSKFMFLQAPVYDARTIVHHLSNIVLQEFRRIQDVKAILAERAKGNKINIDRNLAKNGICDKISLILSLEGNGDERVQMELVKIKREVKW